MPDNDRGAQFDVTKQLDEEKRAVFACMRARLASSDSERVMRARLHACLVGCGVIFHPEVRLADGGGAIDFLSDAGYAVLVANAHETLEDIFLRARLVTADARVRCLLIITTRAVHRKLPGGIDRKAIDVFWLGGVS